MKIPNSLSTADTVKLNYLVEGPTPADYKTYSPEVLVCFVKDLILYMRDILRESWFFMSVEGNPGAKFAYANLSGLIANNIWRDAIEFRIGDEDYFKQCKGFGRPVKFVILCMFQEKNIGVGLILTQEGSLFEFHAVKDGGWRMAGLRPTTGPDGASILVNLFTANFAMAMEVIDALHRLAEETILEQRRQLEKCERIAAEIALRKSRIKFDYPESC